MGTKFLYYMTILVVPNDAATRSKACCLIPTMPTTTTKSFPTKWGRLCES
ncbi:hypothetical protein C1H46_045897 [Malus baccata]|uniref:Uncharacterized protein n=1 Tax=Malus baccata TaxID=106549 RepID=A0A540K2Q9_MALBA|nr:hypothetical protein C1H46_045897 [Malus baccata]